MKQRFSLYQHEILILGIVIVCLCFVAGCAAPSALAETVNAAMADGTISPEERASIQVLLDQDAQSVDWATTLSAAIPAVLASFLGVNVYRNSREKKMWGEPPPAIK